MRHEKTKNGCKDDERNAESLLSLGLYQLVAKGPQIVEAVAGGALRTVKPFTREVQAEIDNTELLPKAIDFMKRQTAAGKSFFLRRQGIHGSGTVQHQPSSMGLAGFSS